MARYNVDLQDNEGNAYQIMANPDSVAEFSPAVNRENIRSGETYRVIFGKIMKYFSEVGNAAYVGLANNCTTTIAGFALDARQGKELMDRINELNRDLGGLSFGQDADGNWGYKIGGADTVVPFKGELDFDYEHNVSIPYVVAAGNPNVLHYYGDKDYEAFMECFFAERENEGLSKETIKNYRMHLHFLFQDINKNVREITDEDINRYLKRYKEKRQVSNGYMNDIRHVFNSFFCWMQIKKHILKYSVAPDGYCLEMSGKVCLKYIMTSIVIL